MGQSQELRQSTGGQPQDQKAASLSRLSPGEIKHYIDLPSVFQMVGHNCQGDYGPISKRGTGSMSCLC